MLAIYICVQSSMCLACQAALIYFPDPKCSFLIPLIFLDFTYMVVPK